VVEVVDVVDVVVDVVVDDAALLPVNFSTAATKAGSSWMIVP
jgi:hypothetical protein